MTDNKRLESNIKFYLPCCDIYQENDKDHEFTIDDTIDRNRIDAEIKNGVVTLTLNIKESEKPRKIAVTQV